jgi:hypothetical protein
MAKLRSCQTALFLLAASFWCQAQVKITPHSSTLLPGQTCAFRLWEGMRRLPAEEWVWTIRDGGPGFLDEAIGAYEATPVADACLVKVRATHRAQPGRLAEATVLVLPYQPFAIVSQVLGPDWLEPFTTQLPFRNPATGLRYDEEARVAIWRMPPRKWEEPQSATYGLPHTLSWRSLPEAEAQLLSYFEGDQLIQKDVTGATSQVLSCTGTLRDVQVEHLKRVPGSGHWQSWTQSLSVLQRGLFPFAGNMALAPGHGDGPRLAAQFLEPFALVTAPDSDGAWRKRRPILVTDPQSHVIRLVSPTGEISTPWGQPGQAGHLDAAPSSLLWKVASSFLPAWLAESTRASTLFNRPTFLSARMVAAKSCRSPSTWEGLVADSGNHVIRTLHPDGSVATLAGVPGQAGYRDAPNGAEALFNNPQGLAGSYRNNLYVADRGNHVIRWLLPTGEVRTLAGSPGQSGSEDGPREAARFTDLRGLAVWNEDLYAVDGHAIRRITLPEGEVITVLGQVDTPGFRDLQGRFFDPQQPCLNHPCGITRFESGLRIADRGNHSVRSWDIRGRTLTTLVGAPGLGGETRFGLLPDGLTVPLDERYATLEAPRGVMVGANYDGDLTSMLVATGCGVAELRTTLEYRDLLSTVTLTCSPATLSEACVGFFSVEATTHRGLPSLRPIHYSVDFIEADGTLAERVRGKGMTSTTIVVPGQFTRRGTGTVVVRCATDQGVSAGAQQEVEVR